MFEQMLRNTINNKVYIFTSEFESEGCTGCAFERDYIGCRNVPDICQHEEGIWAETNLATDNLINEKGLDDN